MVNDGHENGEPSRHEAGLDQREREGSQRTVGLLHLEPTLVPSTGPSRWPLPVALGPAVR